VSTRVVLPNGLRVLASSVRRAPVFTAMLVVEAGSRYDPDGLSGLAALCGGLLFEGTSVRTAQEMARAVDSMGSSLDSVTGYETTAVIASGLVDHCDESLELLFEAASRPAFEPESVDECVRRHLAELAEDESQPYDVCRRDFMRTVFPGHPRGNPVGGLAETVSAATLADLRVFHELHYGPRNAIVAVAGDLEPDRLADMAAERFDAWSGGGAPAAPPQPGRQRGRRVASAVMDTKQVHVSIGNVAIPRSDPLFYAASVMDVILGDSAGFGSRLATRLREERGLAYVIESDATGSAGLEPGVFWAYSATSPAHLEPLVRGVMDELRLARAEPPSEDELEHAVGYLTGHDLLERETSEAVAGRMVHAERHALGDDFDERYPSIVRSVTCDDVLQAARLVIDPDNCSFVTVGPVTADDASLLDP
jgi:zinc protease